MSLQFIIGSSGTGKSHYAYRSLIEKAIKNPKKLYYVIVPEQFTMQTQRTFVDISPGNGILNIDILSFERLAYRVLQETGGDDYKILEETGKNMVLQKVVQMKKEQLGYLGNQMKKQGYLNEMKSMISEFMQYDISLSELEEIAEKEGHSELLKQKLRDVGTLYGGFKEYLEGHYITNEEVMDLLVKMLPYSEKLKNSEILLDGFTGFTPIQINAIRELLLICDKMRVTVTMDSNEDFMKKGKDYHLFYMSREMIRSLSELTKDIEEPFLLFHNRKTRFADRPALEFLERNIFRYRKKTFLEEQDSIQLFAAKNPEDELRETVRRIGEGVRKKGLKYGEIAVITGNLEEYKSTAVQIFNEAGIPYFLDEKHTILMNPFVEYLRAAIDMVIQNFSYESVFRYLRCGMSDLTKEEIDCLENYVLALGIKGFSKWENKWVRIYKKMPAEEIQELNRIREIFVEEVRLLNECFAGKKKSLKEYCTGLYYFIVQCKIQNKLKLWEEYFKEQNNKAMEKEYSQIYGIVMNLLDKMVEILGEEIIGKQEFKQLLEAGLEEAKVALIPPNIDQVLIGDMERTRLKDIKCLFFVGVNEGNIPKNSGNGGIFTETDREAIANAGMQLAPGPKELMNQQRFYLYLHMTKPKEMLCMSYCLTDSKGETISPSYLIGNIRTIFPDIEIKMPKENEEILDKIENSQSGLLWLLEGMQKEISGEKDLVFRELYSWYLQNEKYQEEVKNLVDAFFTVSPSDQISKNVAKVLYGEVSPYHTTRLEKYAACAFAHFLQYGLLVTERAEYEFHALDMGNIVHRTLESFSLEVQKRNLVWAELSEKERDDVLEVCLDNIVTDYGNTVLKSTARNEYIVERVKRILKRTVWALQEQLKAGEFVPERFEVSFGGGRIDRVDTYEEDDKVYVKVIDYKTGNTSFDLVSVYYGLQMQLIIYMDGAVEVEKRKHPDKEIIPAGIFYYNVKDPLINEKIETDIKEIDAGLLKELKMNGLVQADREIVDKIDHTYRTIPVAFNKDGSFRKNSSVATREQFSLLKDYVQKKIETIQDAILAGDAKVKPYQLDKKTPCTYCMYSSVCGFDRKIPGYEFKNFRKISSNDIWKCFEEGVK